MATVQVWNSRMEHIRVVTWGVDYEYMSQHLYKTHSEKKSLVLPGSLGKKGKIKPFEKLKVDELRTELGASTEGLKPALQQKNSKECLFLAIK